MPIAVIGDEDSGKSTFLTLTYAAQIRYTADSKGDFRFYADPENLRVMGAEYSRMLMGEWPSDALRRHNVEFTFGYGMKGGLMGKIFGSKKYSNLKFRSFDVSGKAYDKLKEGDDISSAHITDEMSDLTRCRLWVLLLDTTEKKKADPNTANMVANLVSYARDPIYPVIVLTKYDRMKGKTLKASLVPKIKDKGERAAFVEKALKATYPKTYKFMKGSPKLKEPQVFFSIVKTEKKDKQAIPGLKQGDMGSLQLDYSYDEYVAIIKYIGHAGKEIGWDDAKK